MDTQSHLYTGIRTQIRKRPADPSLFGASNLYGVRLSVLLA